MTDVKSSNQCYEGRGGVSGKHCNFYPKCVCGDRDALRPPSNALCDEIRNIARDAPMSAGTRTRLHAIAHDIENALAPKPTPVETSATPEGVLRWAEESFGPIARNRDERAARLAEEAIEVAQAEGVPLETIERIADRIYSRPVGELGQEVGGLGITLYALTANCGIDLFGEIDREWKRVLSKSRDWWQRKHAEKVAAGTADLRPIQPEEPTPKPSRDAEHCDYPDCEQHWTHVVAKARALLEPLADCDPAIRQWLTTPDLPSLPLKASAPHAHVWKEAPDSGLALCACGDYSEDWYCPESADHVCHYDNGDRDQCDFCGLPEERK